MSVPLGESRWPNPTRDIGENKVREFHFPNRLVLSPDFDNVNLEIPGIIKRTARKLVENSNSPTVKFRDPAERNRITEFPRIEDSIIFGIMHSLGGIWIYIFQIGTSCFANTRSSEISFENRIRRRGIDAPRVTLY